LLLVVLVAAIGSAALANPTNAWKAATITLTVAVLVVATLVAIAGRSSSARGFAVAGWLYFVLVFGTNFGLQDDLLTDWCVDRLYRLVHADAGTAPQGMMSYGDEGGYGGHMGSMGGYDGGMYGYGGAMGGMMGSGYPGSALPRQPNTPNFTAIGHSLWTVFLALIGGLAAGWLQQGREKK